MLRNLRARRRPRFGAHVCAMIAAVLLLLSVSLLHSRLGSSGDSRHYHYQVRSEDDAVSDPLLDDADIEDAHSGKASDDRIDELDDVVQEESRVSDDDDTNSVDSEEDESDRSRGTKYYFDHVNGVIRRAFNKRSIDQWEDYESFDANVGSEDRSKVAFGSDDLPVDEAVRSKMVRVRGIEDALLLKIGSRVSPLREGWGPWFDAKSDFLRRDRMFKSNLETLNPLNNPLLQDPDGVGVTSLTRGDKLFQKSLLNEFKKVPFSSKKPLGFEDSTQEMKLNSKPKPKLVEGVTKGVVKMDSTSTNAKTEEIESFGESRSEMKRVERRTLRDNASIRSHIKIIGDSSNLSLRSNRHGEVQHRTAESIGKVFDSSTSNSVQSRGRKNLEANTKIKSESSSEIHANGKIWGYFPGLHPQLSFSNFIDTFFRKGKCTMRVFMVWNSAPWNFSVRHQRGIESLLFHHQDVCVVVFSETVELNFFEGFVKNGYGGLYLDSDIIVLRPLSALNNTIGLEDEQAGNSLSGGGSFLNGAVMSFRKHSPFIMECLTEFYSTYDETRLRWNGADLLTRVAKKFLRDNNTYNERMELKLLPSFAFFPINRSNIRRYFSAPATEGERAEQDEIFNKISNESFTFHFWDSLTPALLPEPDSLVARLINHFCIRCTDVL
ncbi:uncharacterized protein At4g19900 isoform X2 [Diospyros lotus]|uniref:uncharacterized protein At4g19900 isoform X2 n=1 Tax=Diospyros lotus TaxID=55363 RepID=UPI0022578E06|nr:uncharacterized protein At4g19900 isoform X2 [Diospyros lotus]